MEKNKKNKEEWCISVPWGKLAGLSWGSQSNPPVLMVHGLMDSAATFIPIAEILPDNFFYVAMDFPGHGKSDPFAHGIPVSITHQVEAIRQLVKHMNWKSFIIISHSMGVLTTCLYNAAFPHQISKMVNLEPTKAIYILALTFGDFPFWKYNLYENYYSNLSKSKHVSEYTYEEALDIIQRERNVKRDYAEILLSRSLEKTGGGKYRFTWDFSVKRPVLVPFDEDTLCSFFALHAPPMLNTIASDPQIVGPWIKIGEAIIERLQKTIPFFITVPYTGGHNHHVIQPKDFINEIIDFLNTDYVKSKL
ncbi:serine hydrolase-like protein [Zerene cesonia]|uniref:serine hydrolase-like protein n=1 Tax=Zerene cesonia TaxID=33412 RepID=UPI0018E59FF1|nr:serine hydrolase-like protein [Zerene cesonia]